VPDTHIHVHVSCDSPDGGGDDSITAALEQMETRFMAQIDDLRAAIAQVGTDLGEAVSRVEAKITELGEPDPDLTADIANLRSVSSQLDSLVAEQPDTPDEPTEPATNPVTPTEPAEPPVDGGTTLSPEPGSGETV
jgi:hypothetical protein